MYYMSSGDGRAGQGLGKAEQEIRKDEAKTETSSDLRPQIAKRAYELYEQRGRREGHAVQDWLQAEREIRKDESPK